MAAFRSLYSVGAPVKAKNGSMVSPVVDDEELEVIAVDGNNNGFAEPLQLKSSLRTSSRFFQSTSSNQDRESSQSSDSSEIKYAVVGQKQQWRKSRSQRSSERKTISPVDTSIDVREEREEYGERASSYISDSIPALLSSRSSIHSSRNSSFSSHESSQICSGDERFVITRQKKTKYSAKIHLPGQNPLYLGRYQSEEAARAACEAAFQTITTPRQ